MKFKILLLLYIFHLSHSYRFTPRNREIHVLEGDQYVFGFRLHQDIVKCSYTSNLGQGRSFNIDFTSMEKDNEPPQREGDNQVWEMGQTGKCMINVLSATSSGATTWTITAYNRSTELESVTVNVHYVSAHSIKYFPESGNVDVAQGGEYMVGFAMSEAITFCILDADNGAFVQLFEVYRDDEYETPKEALIYEKPGSPKGSEQVYSSGPLGMCAIHVTYASIFGFSKISLTATTHYRNITTADFYIDVISKYSLDFTPSTREIFVGNGEEYAFGFMHHKAIHKCYIESDQGHSDSFIVEQSPESKDVELIFPSRTANHVWSIYGQHGLCKIHISDAKNDGVNWWQITASDGNYNISSEIVNVTYYATYEILSKSIVIYPGATLVNSLGFINVKIVRCTLHFGNRTIHFVDEKQLIKNQYVVSGKIIPWEYNVCGFKYTDFQEEDMITNLNWHLVATDEKGEHYGNSFSITMKKAIKIPVEEVVLGSTYTIPCNFPDQQFCELYNPAGELVKRDQQCDFYIETISLEDIGTWKCLSNQEGSMRSIELEIVVAKIDMKVIGYTKEDDKSVTIGCNFPKETWVYSCQIVSPDERRFVLSPYLATKTYSAIGTELSKGKCAFQIAKPLPEKDAGLWICEINVEDLIIGTIIDVHSTSKPNYPKYTKKSIRAYENFQVACKVPYSSPNCYIQSPKGTILPIDNFYEPSIGRCSVTVASNFTDKNGNWSCFFARESKQETEQIIVEIETMPVSPPVSVVKIDEGSKLRLLYQTGGEPLRHCIFISPNNDSYYIENHQENPTIKYYGDGMEFGDCGIEKQVAKEDFGDWMCVVKVGFQPSQQYPSAKIIVIHPTDPIPELEMIHSENSPIPEQDRKFEYPKSDTTLTILEIGLMVLGVVILAVGVTIGYRRCSPGPVFFNRTTNEAVNMTFFKRGASVRMQHRGDENEQDN